MLGMLLVLLVLWQVLTMSYIHTAALKQVPILERFSARSLKKSIEGTDHLLDSTIALGVKMVICISFDKALYPVNAMGLSKAFMVKLIFSKAAD